MNVKKKLSSIRHMVGYTKPGRARGLIRVPTYLRWYLTDAYHYPSHSVCITLEKIKGVKKSLSDILLISRQGRSSSYLLNQHHCWSYSMVLDYVYERRIDLQRSTRFSKHLSIFTAAGVLPTSTIANTQIPPTVRGARGPWMEHFRSF